MILFQQHRINAYFTSMKNKPYCLMPWIHFHVGNGGVAKACCVANIPYGNIDNENLDEIWNGVAINKIRAKFLKGETDKRCANCHQLEATGAKSIRQETFEKFGHIVVEEKEVKLPIYFDIRFSNVCNFRCRTCWHGASSKWFADAKALGTNIGQQAILKNIKDVDAFIEKMEPALLNAEEFYFAGGEPLVTKEHYVLLEWLIKNNATGARLRYNTNFSKLGFQQYDALKMWEHFPEVELLASIDGSASLGEYIRKEMKWQEIVDNREHIRRLPHIQFKISPTVSVLNVGHLPDLYEQCLELNMIAPEDIYINILERPDYYNIQILSADQKAAIQVRYQRFFDWLEVKGISKNIKPFFEEILNYMMALDRSHLWPKFLKANGRLDELRGEVLKNEKI